MNKDWDESIAKSSITVRYIVGLGSGSYGKMFLYEEAAHMYERAYEVNPDASILKPYLYCCYKYLPEDAYGKMLSKEQTYLNLNSELKEDMKEALQQAESGY